jgi:Rod binding domain-containing protein
MDPLGSKPTPAIPNWAKGAFNDATKSDLPHLNTEDEKIAEVSKQFEAIILRNFLKDSLKPLFKSHLAQDNSQNNIYRYHLVDALSQSMAESQSLGLSNVLQMQLKSQYATGANKDTSE